MAADRERCTRRSRSVMPSPVVELNRAVAVAMAFGPEAGLALVDELERPRVRWRHIICCRASAAICCRSSAVSTKLARSSCAPRR